VKLARLREREREKNDAQCFLDVELRNGFQSNLNMKDLPWKGYDFADL
jgi:hypothetical protein